MPLPKWRSAIRSRVASSSKEGNKEEIENINWIHSGSWFCSSEKRKGRRSKSIRLIVNGGARFRCGVGVRNRELTELSISTLFCFFFFFYSSLLLVINTKCLVVRWCFVLRPPEFISCHRVLGVHRISKTMDGFKIRCRWCSLLFSIPLTTNEGIQAEYYRRTWLLFLSHTIPPFFFSGDFVKNCVLQWRNYTDEQEGVEQGPGRLWRRTACYILSLSAFSLMTHPICIPRFGRLVILFIFSFPSPGTTNFNGPSSWLSFRALLWIKFTREDVGGGEVFLTDIKEIKFIWESIESRETPEVINNNEETTPIRKTGPSASTGNHFSEEHHHHHHRLYQLNFSFSSFGNWNSLKSKEIQILPSPQYYYRPEWRRCDNVQCVTRDVTRVQSGTSTFRAKPSAEFVDRINWSKDESGEEESEYSSHRNSPPMLLIESRVVAAPL